MIIEHKRVIDLTPEQTVRCKELSFGDEGYMCEDLDRIRWDEQGWHYRYSMAILLRENNGIVGWSLVEPIYRRRSYTAHFFVDPDYRGRGYGKILLHEANRYCKSPHCFVDEENIGFFSRYPSLCSYEKEFA